MAEIDKVQFLRQVSLFSSLSDRTLFELSSITMDKHVPRKTTVFKEGDEADSLYIVKTGKVNILKQNEAGIDLKIATLGKDAVIGEMAIIDDQPRSATLATVHDTIFLYISKDDFRRLLIQVPEISFQILKLTSERLRVTNQHLRELESSANQMEEVVRVITKIARKSNLLSLNASIEASRVGKSGVAFSVVASEMKKLAEDSAQEAKKIETLLQTLQSKARLLQK